MKKAVMYGILAFVALVVIFASWKTSNAAKGEVQIGPQVGFTAPDFTLTDINGSNIKLSDIYRKNKVTLVNFWATWCPPCRGEIPELIKLYQKYNPQKLGLLAVDLGESRGDVKSFAIKNGMKFTVAVDGSGEVGNRYRVYSIPSTFILDHNGKILDIIIGGTTLETLETKIKPLLQAE